MDREFFRFAKEIEEKVVFQWVFSIPSGKRLHNYGKSPFLMGKSNENPL